MLNGDQGTEYTDREESAERLEPNRKMRTGLARPGTTRAHARHDLIGSIWPACHRAHVSTCHWV